MSDPSDTALEGHEPTAQELAARNRRNTALGIGLAVFMVFVFFTMLSRAGAL